MKKRNSVNYRDWTIRKGTAIDMHLRQRISEYTINYEREDSNAEHLFVC